MQNNIERANIVTIYQNALKDIDSQYVPYVKENIFDEGNITKYLLEINTKLFACTCVLYDLEQQEEREDVYKVEKIIESLNRAKANLEQARSDKAKELILGKWQGDNFKNQKLTLFKNYFNHL